MSRAGANSLLESSNGRLVPVGKTRAPVYLFDIVGPSGSGAGGGDGTNHGVLDALRPILESDEVCKILFDVR